MNNENDNKALYFGQPSNNYPDLLSEIPRYCYPVKKIFKTFFTDKIKIHNCLLRSSKRKCRKLSFSKTRQNDARRS